MTAVMLAVGCLPASAADVARDVSVTVGPPQPSTVMGVTITPSPVGVGQTATITVTGTNPCTMLWMDFGDGNWWIAPINSLPFTTTHTWASAGSYTVLARGYVRFTGKPRDAETGLDYFGARYYAQGAGRFTGVDPVMTTRDNLLDSQRWNRFTYARNNPMRFVDLDGRCVYPGADCEQYLIGGLKDLVNVVSDTASLVNKAVNLVIAPVTDFRWGEAPRFEATNEDQRRGMIAASISMLFAPAAGSIPGRARGGLTITFGRNDNASAHAFRHIEEAGLSREAVQQAIAAHVNTVGQGMSPGQLTTQTIRGAGRDVTYNAYVLKDGSINVGRITTK